MSRTLSLGALPVQGGVQFRVWAPTARRVELLLESRAKPLPLDAAGDGYFERFVPELAAGARYQYRLDGAEHAFPDPASRFQPEGVHGPSMVVDPQAFSWTDDGWAGIPQQDLVFYELHVGTFSPEGSYGGVQERLPYLKELGITAIELMPVADFPGRWNWGYDHAALFAPSRAYGTPDELRALIDAAHATGLAVYLDVIYNHLGPDGAYIAAFGPLFTDKHHTPWGQAINLDDTHSEGVRDLFIQNALHWLNEYHADGLRLDATHALEDDSETHFLAELADAVAAHTGDPRRVLIAEDPRNLNTLVRPRGRGGYGLDGVWADDFHHQIRNMTAGDTESYYADFADTTMADVAETLHKGWFYDGKPTRRTGARRGTDASEVRPDQCVICIQNHDQVGNRPWGNRLTDEVDQPTYHAVSALLLFAPELPLLFMGQEWGATTPFQFFTDHNPELGKLVSKGRKEEFQHFSAFTGDVPDPQDPETFRRSKLNWDEPDHPVHAHTLNLYRDLLQLRTQLRGEIEATAHGPRALSMHRGRHHLLVTLEGDVTMPLPEGTRPIWHTEQDDYAGDARPPEVTQEAVRFHRAGALLTVAG